MGWIMALLVVEWIARQHQHALEHIPGGMAARWSTYALLVIIVLLHVDLSNAREFIYFQF